MLKEFKEFALKGNVLDLAVGVIMGAAFGKVITSMVNDVLMPPLGKIVGGVDFKNLFINLSGNSYPSLEAAKTAGAATVNYGLFLNTLVDFTIVAFVIFILVKNVNRFMKKEAAKPAVPPPPSTQEKLLMEIRDLLAKKS